MDITTAEANHVLHLFGEGGYAAGHFTQKLMELMCFADNVNLERLALAFPGYAAAVRLAKYDMGGIARLKVIAEPRT